MRTRTHSEPFDFQPGMVIANKYVIIEKLGEGFEGEVYKIMEKGTKIERAAKFFFPERNERNKAATQYAKLLHDLSSCSIVIHYHTHEYIKVRGQIITCLISEYVEGELLSDFLKKHHGGYIGIFRGLQLLHALASGLESMHQRKLYHGDLHSCNVMVKRSGLGFELKLLDMYYWGNSYRLTAFDDILDCIKIFYEAIGGQKRYAKQPIEIKEIIMGLKHNLIRKKFRSATALKIYLENIHWRSNVRA